MTLTKKMIEAGAVLVRVLNERGIQPDASRTPLGAANEGSKRGRAT